MTARTAPGGRGQEVERRKSSGSGMVAAVPERGNARVKMGVTG